MSVQDDWAQLSEVLIRYANGIDTKDWSLFRSCLSLCDNNITAVN